MWFSRLAAVTNHFMSGEKRRWYGSRMPRSVRCTSAVRGSMKVSESLPALATMTDFSSGVRYRWCGSRPVGMRLISVQVIESMTLTSPSSELSTNTGAPRRDGVAARAGKSGSAVSPSRLKVRRRVAEKWRGMGGTTAGSWAINECSPGLRRRDS